MQLLQFLTKVSLENKVIREEEIEIYEYGVINLVVAVINYFAYFLVTLLTKNIFLMLIFLCAFKPLRTHAGGLHLKTRISCLATSTLFVYLTSLLLKSSILLNYIWLCIVGVIAGYLIIMILAPVETPNRPLDKQEKEMFGFRTKWILHLELVLCSVFLVANQVKIFSVIAVAIMQVALIVLVGWISNKKSSSIT